MTYHKRNVFIYCMLLFAVTALVRAPECQEHRIDLFGQIKANEQTKAKTRAKAKAKTKAKTRAKAKAKTRAKAKAKTKAKTRAKAKAKTKTKTNAGKGPKHRNTKDRRTGITWVKIRGGRFLMGSKTGDSDEGPVHRVRIRSFWMAKTEITVAQYQKCVAAGACSKPQATLPLSYGNDIECNWEERGYEEHPVNCLGKLNAIDYCKWAGARLPTEAEWEYAARSGGQNIKYPWGNEKATCGYAVMLDGLRGCGSRRTMKVCSKQAGNTDQGLCDMAGNIWEWVKDSYHRNYKGAPRNARAWNMQKSYIGVLRGGSFLRGPEQLRVTNREKYFTSHDNYREWGFRCAK